MFLPPEQNQAPFFFLPPVFTCKNVLVICKRQCSTSTLALFPVVFVTACNSPQLQQPAHRAGSGEISCSCGDKRSAFSSVQGSNKIKRGLKLTVRNARWQLLRELAAEFDRNRGEERRRRELRGYFPGCMWHLSNSSQHFGNPTLVKSERRELAVIRNVRNAEMCGASHEGESKRERKDE